MTQKNNGSQKPATQVSARAVAAEVVHQVLTRGGFTAAVLDKKLREVSLLDARDRGLATELAYGVVRTHAALSRRVLAHAPRGISDPSLLAHLLVAAYQILLLDRVPSFAAVNEAVGEISRLRGRPVAAFANALLRRLCAEARLTRSDAIRESTPEWLWQELARSVGEAEASWLLGASHDQGDAQSAVTVRFRRDRELPTWARQAEPGRLCPWLRRFRHAGDLRRHPEYAAGDFVVQEEGACVAGLALGARPGEKVLDACAGRGQKSTLLAEQIGPAGVLWVTDKSPKKLNELGREFTRLGFAAPRAAVVDWTQGAAPELPTDFDRVLVDAPCTGSGTLRHRPEIALRLSPDDVERLALTANRILSAAAEHVRPGGRLLFVVCSVLHRECQAAVEQHLPECLEPVAFDAPELLDVVAPNQHQLQLLPSVHGTDGFFIASFRRRS